jgi:monoamine oxidase
MTPPLSAAKLVALQTMTSEPAVTVAMLFPGEKVRLRDGREQWSVETSSSRFRATTDAEGALLLEAQFLGARAEPLVGQPDTVLGAFALRGFAEVLPAELKVSDTLWMASHDWIADRFARGAKTLAATTADHLTLAESMGNTVFFAGEATADPQQVGTVHGAFASGIRAAREVASSLDIEHESEDPNSPVILELF